MTERFVIVMLGATSITVLLMFCVSNWENVRLRRKLDQERWENAADEERLIHRIRDLQDRLAEQKRADHKAEYFHKIAQMRVLLHEFVQWTDFAGEFLPVPKDDEKSEDSQVQLSVGDCHRIAVTRHLAGKYLTKDVER